MAKKEELTTVMHAELMNGEKTREELTTYIPASIHNEVTLAGTGTSMSR